MVIASLVVPFALSSTDVSGSATSVTARAAQAGQPGGAERYAVGSSALEAAKSTAIAHWGAQPCRGNIQLAWVPLDRGTNGTASWRNPTDAWNNASENFDCRIDLNTQADFDFPKLCSVLAHEIGHLLGQQHDPNPGQLMSAFYTAALPSCEAASLESAPAVAVDTEIEDDWADAPIATEPVLKKRTLRKTAKTRTKLVRKCTFRRRSGKRVKRCRTVRVKVVAKKATRR